MAELSKEQVLAMIEEQAPGTIKKKKETKKTAKSKSGSKSK